MARNPLASLPPDVQALIVEKNRSNPQQLGIVDTTYYSTCRFAGVRAAGPPVTFTYAVAALVAFSYGIGQLPSNAGFPAAFGNATQAETNLQDPNQTNNNSDFAFWGIAIEPSPEADAALLTRLFRHCSVALLMGSTTIPLGTLSDFPSAGGLYGVGRSFTKVPAFDTTGGGEADNGEGSKIGVLSNGNPMAGNYRRLYQPFYWAKRGQPGADTQINIQIKLERQVVDTAGLARAFVAAGTANMVAGLYTPPADGALGSHGDFKVKLIGVEIRPKSTNA